MTDLERLGAWVASLRIADVPDDVAVRLRVQALSVLGATAASRSAPEGPALEAAGRGAGQGSLGIAPGLSGLSLDGALLAAPSLSVLQDWDDWLLCGHTGHSAVWVSFLLGAEHGREWPEVLRAQLAANEVMGRLGGLALLGHENGQAWSFIHAAGAAVVASSLRGLDGTRTAHALALALASAPICDWRLFESSGKAGLAAGPIALGLRAAALAAAGLSGPLHLLDDGSDFLTTFADGRPVRGFLTGLGSAWLTRTLSVKAVPGCAYLGTTVEALERLAAEFRAEQGRELRPEDVQRIDIEAGLLTVAMERLLGPRAPLAETSVATTFSAARTAALRVVTGSAGAEVLARGVLGPVLPAVSELAGRVHVHHDLRASWAALDELRKSLGADRLLSGMGPAAIIAAARRFGVDGGVEAGLSLAELPLTVASERLQGLDAGAAQAAIRELSMDVLQDPAGVFSRGVGRVAAWAARGFERAAAREPRKPGPYDLADYDLGAVSLPVPARVRVLLHGGRVREAEARVAAGSCGRPLRELAAIARAKLQIGAALAGATDGRAAAIADRLLPFDGAPSVLPPGGPRELLAEWAS